MLSTLLLTCLLLAPAVAVGLPSDLTFRPIEATAPLPVSAAVAEESGCDDGTLGGTFIEGLGDYFGNRLTSACGGGSLSSIRFTYFGAGVTGPYQYRLHVLDATCQPIAVTELLTAPDAADAPQEIVVDVAERGWCVSEDFYVLLEPLSCADGLRAQDCFPALVVDTSSDSNWSAHCAVVSTVSVTGRECHAARSADGRYFDFLLRAEVECSTESCSTPIDALTWSHLKRLFRQP